MNCRIIIMIIIIILCVYIIKKNDDNFTMLKKPKIVDTSDLSIDNISSIYYSTDNIMSSDKLNIDKTTVNDLNVTIFNLIPDGMIFAFNGINIPDGWVICDGGTYTRKATELLPLKTLKLLI